MTAAITIVGLGPGPAAFRTVAAQRALDSASHIYLRVHEGVDLPDLVGRPNVTDLSEFRNRSTGWQLAAQAVIAGAQQEPVVLAIPGHPRFGEGLVRTVLEMASDIGLPTDVIDGISATDMLASALDLDPIHDRVQLVSGWRLAAIDSESPFAGGLLQLSPSLPILVTHLYDADFLAAAQSQLRRILPDDHPVEMIMAAGLESESRLSTTIGKLLDHPGAPLLAIYVTPMGDLDATHDPATLQHIVARLRQEDGCPWDRKQTNASLAQSLVDEVYEAVDAINTGDDANLAEELGDLLLLIMMHAQIAEERGAFQLEDVYHGIATKIVRRHPHVFGDEAAQSAEDVVGVWQQVKQQEKADRPGKPEKAADGQPHSMPALTRASRVLAKHPVPAQPGTPESRQQALFDAVAAIVVAGDDPDEVLRIALENHVAGSL